MSVLNTLARGLSSSTNMADSAANYDRHALSYIFEAVTGFLTVGVAAVAIESVHDEKRQLKRSFFAAAAPLILKGLKEQCMLPAGSRGPVEVSVGRHRFTMEENDHGLVLTDRATGECREIPGKDFETAMNELAAEIASDPETYGTHATEVAEEAGTGGAQEVAKKPALGVPDEIVGEITKFMAETARDPETYGTHATEVAEEAGTGGAKEVAKEPALGVPDEIVGEITKFMDGGSLVALSMVSRSLEESVHVRAGIVQSVCAQMDQKGLDGLKDSLPLIANLAPGLRLGSLQALAERIKRLLPETDRRPAFDVLVAEAHKLPATEKWKLFGKLVDVAANFGKWEECSSAWNTCWDAVAGAHAVGQGRGEVLAALAEKLDLCFLIADRQRAFESVLAEVTHLDEGPTKARALAELADGMSYKLAKENGPSNLAAILPEILKLDGVHPGKAHALASVAQAMRLYMPARSVYEPTVAFKEVLRAVVGCVSVADDKATALGAIASSIQSLPKLNQAKAFEEVFGHVAQLPTNVQGVVLVKLLGVTDSVPEEKFSATVSELLTVAVALPSNAQKTADTLTTLLGVFDRLPDEDFPAAFHAVMPAVVRLPSDNVRAGETLVSLLGALDRLADEEVPAARAQIVPFVQRLVDDGRIDLDRLRQRPEFVRMMERVPDRDLLDMLHMS